MSKESEKAIWVGDSFIRVEDLKQATASDFCSDKLIIVIHGFTAHGAYLVDLCEYLQRHNFKVLLYNYNSYRGITEIAKTFEYLLSVFDNVAQGAVSNNGFFLIAHSLGGLIARQLISYNWVRSVTKGIVMLGTPNDGTLNDKRSLHYLIEYGRNLSELLPALNIACPTAQELIKRDTPKSVLRLNLGIIDTLNYTWKKSTNLPPCLTISGGLNKLQIFPGRPRANYIANRAIQRAMKGQTNDGLVPERSVDLTQFIIGQANNIDYTHLNSYPEFRRINHSNLKDNQSIRLRLISWLNQHP